MRSPLDEGPWLEQGTVTSTQNVAASLLDAPDCPGVVFADHQAGGRGRFGRTWVSSAGDSLTMSLVFRSYAGHARPWLLGMAIAVAVADALSAQVRWPNDVVVGARKLGGVLTELLPSQRLGKVPVVGVGVNVNQSAFPPELADAATSVYIERGTKLDPRALAHEVIARIAQLPEPDDWSVLAPVWMELDATPGKRYRLPTGELAEALRIGPNGELVCRQGGAERTVMAADAIFGS